MWTSRRTRSTTPSAPPRRPKINKTSNKRQTKSSFTSKALQCSLVLIMIMVVLFNVSTFHPPLWYWNRIVDTSITTTTKTVISATKEESLPTTTSSRNRSDKRVAFIGNVEAYRWGGGAFLEVTKKIFSLEPLLKDGNNQSIYRIQSTNIISKLETGEVFKTQWCSCNFWLGWVKDWNVDVILWNNEYYDSISSNG